MNEFETAVVNESSVFKPLKFYCISYNKISTPDKVTILMIWLGYSFLIFA